MAERFYCDEEIVYWTNGACEEIFRGWKLCCNALKHNDLESIFDEYLCYGSGLRATGINTEFLDSRLKEQSVQKKWLEVMDMLIMDIQASGNIAAKLDINWSHELIEKWSFRLKKMRNTLKNMLIE